MKEFKKDIIIIQFSSRKDGNCAAVSRAIHEYYGDKMLGYTADSSAISPCGNCNYECLMNEKRCLNISDTQIKIMDAVCKAKLVYFIVPNYCGFPCANYFAYNEKSVGYFNKDEELLEIYLSVPKRFIIISNAEDDVFSYAMQQQTNSEPEILYLKAKKYGKNSIDGNILESAEAQADLKAFLDKYYTRIP